jgi:hypothetical protein
MQQALAIGGRFQSQDCAKCHAEPAKGKTDGRLLYAGVCHLPHSHLRAAMVPDLRTLNHPTMPTIGGNDTHGRRIMMPALLNPKAVLSMNSKSLPWWTSWSRRSRAARNRSVNAAFVSSGSSSRDCQPQHHVLD